MKSRNSRFALVTAVIAGSLTLTLTLTATTAAAGTPTPIPRAERTITASDGYYAVANGAVFTPSQASAGKSDLNGGAPGGQVTPLLLDPVDSLECNVRNNANHMVTSYSAAARGGFVGGTIRLFCGTSAGSGYKHIRDRHATDWSNKLTKHGLAGAWDDLMDFATRQALAAPDYATDQGSGKSCFTTPVQLYRSNGTLLETFKPRVVISRNNTLVITSIPGGGC